MRLLIISLLIFTLSGCSGVLVRTGKDNQFGSPLAGLEYASMNTMSCSIAAFYVFPPVILVTIPVGLVDMAASFVTDIVFLPVDLIIDEPEEFKEELCPFMKGP